MMQELRMTEVKDCQQLEAARNGAEDWGSIEIAGWGWRIYGTPEVANEHSYGRAPFSIVKSC